MNDPLFQDILGYMDFLRGKGYLISISCFHKSFPAYVAQLLAYEAHMPAVCGYLKSCQPVKRMCFRNKQMLTNHPPKSPCYACCWAGVEEYVFPIRYEDTLIFCVHVSGYKGKLKKSAIAYQRVAPKCGEKFPSLYAGLSNTVPSPEDIHSMLAPLRHMVLSLYEKQATLIEALTPADKLYHRMLDYIADNYMLPIACHDIAKALCYSPSYLRSVFRQKSGMPISEYINRFRLSQAAGLLRYSTGSVTQIAYETGFSDSNYFSTVFKKTYGTSPKKYRLSFAEDIRPTGEEA